ncbi:MULTISPECIES: hypothetical protein [Mycolicibacter]|uniref:Uncharacterized protein n=2 Tax=Mycolicibacter TaxID=1073531 RepID=A0AA91F0A2_9MYCO|nr:MULTISPECIES: hypothetical protein [Mycobacteriaceae]UVO10747.1 hypothetical protein NM962_11915 [Mycobacterium sp. SVM_VP21]OBG35648.1 hypothetical protein A5671_02420 [Mycolicibacter heraklionensis]OBJ33809.1 hypothetical protein A5631_00030 [Mycolicibacter heraklionensis]OBK85826.1 hypothetical protein A5649_02050 [Mycolicibacter heraklionensis]PQM54074.1 hypothetical protein C5U48_01190 [Mycolicibacter virginiensis]
MAWFLALNATPTKGVQAPTYELHETADLERITEEMATFAATDRAVAVPAVFNNGRQQVTVYVRPAAWGAWAIYELSEEERREMMANNPLVNALAQARAAKQQGAQSQQVPGMFAPQQPPSQAGPSVIPRLD